MPNWETSKEGRETPKKGREAREAPVSLPPDLSSVKREYLERHGYRVIDPSGRERETPKPVVSSPSESFSVREDPRELQIEIEHVAENIWDELSPEAKNALEALASKLTESE